MKKNIYIFFITTILFLAVLVFAFIKFETINPERYEDYKVFNYHLSFLNAYPTESDDIIVEINSQKYSVNYRRITSSLDNQFVLAKVRSMGLYPGAPEYFIMQNPDNYIDVFQNWTISKIELYQKAMSSIQSDLKMASYDAGVFAEFMDFVMDEVQKKKFVPQEGFQKEYSYIEPLFIRVYFNETKDIVWESTITTYYSKQLQTRDILMDKGTELNGFTKNEDYVLIENYPILHEWISTSIDEIKQGNNITD